MLPNMVGKMKMTEKLKDGMRMTAGTLLLAGSLLATTVMAFALVKAQANENTRNITRHEDVDEKKWEKAFSEIEENTDDITAIRLQNTRLESNQQEILRRMDEYHAEMRYFISNFEVE